MPSSQLRDTLALRVNERLFYGWVMLGVAGLGMFASGPGQSHIFSVFILPIARTSGSRTPRSRRPMPWRPWSPPSACPMSAA